jgi:hypothetical protein
MKYEWGQPVATPLQPPVAPRPAPWTTGFFFEDLVSGPQRRVFFLGTSFQVRLEVWTGYWESRFRSFIEDSSHLDSGPRRCQLGNNCHTDRNSQIKKFLNLPDTPPFYKAHDRERAVTRIIFQALSGQTDRQTLFRLHKVRAR